MERAEDAVLDVHALGTRNDPGSVPMGNPYGHTGSVGEFHDVFCLVLPCVSGSLF